jgi:hypothetical protein
MNANLLSTRYEFSPGFRQYENETFVAILQSAFDRVSHTAVVSSLRDTDHTIRLAEALREVKNEIEQFRFQNSYRKDEVFLTTDRNLVISTRKLLQSAIFKFDSLLSDVKLAIETQLFLMKHTGSAELNSQVIIVNSFQQVIDPENVLRGELAVDNLKALYQYFLSLSKSMAMQTIRENLVELNTIQPTISFGSKTSSSATMNEVEWPEAVKF